MTRAVPPQQPALFEIALTCHRTHHTRFLSVHPGTDVAAWLARHMGQPAPAKAVQAQPKASRPKPTLGGSVAGACTRRDCITHHHPISQTTQIWVV